MRTTRLLAALAAAALVAGCGGEGPRPSTLPSESASPSTSASPTPTATPPVLPASAKVKSKAGAIAFTRTFIETVNFAGADGDTKALRRLYIDFCTRCEALADGIDQTYAAGGYFKGGGWTPTTFKFYAIKNGVAFLDATVDYDSQIWVEKAGAKPRNFPASQRNLKAFNLRWSNAGWRVSALDPNK